MYTTSFLMWITTLPILFLKWSEVAQSCPTLCDPMDCSLPGSSVHGIFQAIVLEWIAIFGSKRCYKYTCFWAIYFSPWLIHQQILSSSFFFFKSYLLYLQKLCSTSVHSSLPVLFYWSVNTNQYIFIYYNYIILVVLYIPQFKYSTIILNLLLSWWIGAINYYRVFMFNFLKYCINVDKCKQYL